MNSSNGYSFNYNWSFHCRSIFNFTGSGVDYQIANGTVVSGNYNDTTGILTLIDTTGNNPTAEVLDLHDKFFFGTHTPEKTFFRHLPGHVSNLTKRDTSLRDPGIRVTIPYPTEKTKWNWNWNFSCYRPQMKLQDGNVLHLSVSHSVHGIDVSYWTESPRIETPLHRDPLDRDHHLQRPCWTEIHGQRTRGQWTSWTEISCGQRPPIRKKRAVRILLECILASCSFLLKIYASLTSLQINTFISIKLQKTIIWWSVE